MAAVHHLPFLKSETISARVVKRVNVRYHAKFVVIGQTVAELWRFLIFKMAAARHLDY